MAVRQYVGARYVPMFYENSLGTAEWQQGVAYDPLTIVTLNGNSFTSKKAVPANIGQPNLNPEYWASTGIYNAQIDEYREETAAALQTAQAAGTAAANAQTSANNAQSAADAAQSSADDAQDNVDALEQLTNYYNKYFMLIGDSYANRDNSWEERFKDAMGLTEGTNCFSSRVSGTGFTPAGALSWLNIITGMASGMSAEVKGKITDILVIGGANDRTADESTIVSAINDFYTYAHTQFPNAKIYLGMVGWSGLCDQMSNMLKALRAYKHACESGKCIYLNGVEYALHNLAYLEDDYHPNADGRQALARAIISAWKEGRADISGVSNIVVYPDSVFNDTVFDMTGGGNSNRIWSGIDGESSWIKFERISAAVSSNAAAPATWYTLADLTGYGYVMGDTTGRTYSCSGFLRAVSGGAWIMAPYEVRVMNHQLQIRFTNVENKIPTIYQFFAGGLQLFFNSMNQRY